MRNKDYQENSKAVKDEFFKKNDEQGIALTYDDVRLKTGYSDTEPYLVKLESRFSRNVPLRIPIVSAAMDMVTGYRLAAEIAKLGGLGVIHKNFTPEKQAVEVARVKDYLSGLIRNPVCFSEEESIEKILEKRREESFSFLSFPIVNSEGKLTGILTGNDFDFCDEPSRKALEIMSRDVISAPSETTSDQAYEIMKQARKKVLPLVDPNGFVAGLYTFKNLRNRKNYSTEWYNLDERGQLRVAAAIGVGDDALERAELLSGVNVDVLVIDTAHGDSRNVVNTIRELKKIYPHLDLVAGNVSQPESARRLCEAGADGIKVGQGPGSICSTRIVAGVGCPQLTAVYKCSKAADEFNVPVCADGGLRYSGDIPIAIGAGAHSVMMGSMLAGTDESPGEVVSIEGKQWKHYRGMGSLGAMTANKSSRERYRQCETESRKLVPEGVEGLVPYKGKLEDVVFQYVGGLRSGMGYVGAKNIDELREKADFDRITHAGQSESHPHTIVMTREAPNYSGTGR